jgi:hypothetical protein
MNQKIILVIAILIMQFSAMAQLGALAVYPTRLTLDDKVTREEVSFINLSSDSMTFTVTFGHYRMSEDGALTLLDKPDADLLIADDYLRIFPRIVTLAPKEQQKLSIQYKRKPGMAAGEYRAHLTFSQFIDGNKLAEKLAELDSTKFTSILMQKFKIAIPVLIRAGETVSSSTITDIKLLQQDSIKTIECKINRQGNGSLFGNITVEFTPLNGKPYPIAVQNSVGVYTEINRRHCKIRLNPAVKEVFKNGKIKVTFNSMDKDKPVKSCEAEIDI